MKTLLLPALAALLLGAALTTAQAGTACCSAPVAKTAVETVAAGCGSSCGAPGTAGCGAHATGAALAPADGAAAVEFAVDGHAGHEQGATTMEHAVGAADAPEAYPLTTCPISGETLGEMGDPVSIDLDGVEVRLCCDTCVKKARARSAEVEALVRDALVARDGASYPLAECASCGMALKEGKALDLVHGSTLVKVCGEMCRGSFAENGAELAKKVRQARAAAGSR